MTKEQPITNDSRVEIVKLMRRALAERQARRDRYSLRAFALSLKLTPAELSEVLSGKRSVTRKMARKILSALSVDPDTERRLISGLPEKQVRRKRVMGSPSVNSAAPTRNSALLSFIQLSTDQFHVMADWYYLAILSLVETESFRSDADWIAARLGITKYQARAAIDTLVRLDLLVRDEEGTLHIPGQREKLD